MADNANQTGIAVLLNLVQAVYTLNQTVAKVFPQTIGTATTATGGSETLPSNPVGFLSLVNPVTGGTVKVPYYT
jgi:hypothetical protein